MTTKQTAVKQYFLNKLLFLTLILIVGGPKAPFYFE
jgi:hypothetical protein